MTEAEAPAQGEYDWFCGFYQEPLNILQEHQKQYSTLYQQRRLAREDAMEINLLLLVVNFSHSDGRKKWVSPEIKGKLLPWLNEYLIIRFQSIILPQAKATELSFDRNILCATLFYIISANDYISVATITPLCQWFICCGSNMRRYEYKFAPLYALDYIEESFTLGC